MGGVAPGVCVGRGCPGRVSRLDQLPSSRVAPPTPPGASCAVPPGLIFYHLIFDGDLLEGNGDPRCLLAACIVLLRRPSTTETIHQTCTRRDLLMARPDGLQASLQTGVRWGRPGVSTQGTEGGREGERGREREREGGREREGEGEREREGEGGRVRGRGREGG